LNLLILSYLCARSARPDDEPEDLAKNFDKYFVGLIEGDDGIFVDRGIDKTIIEELGLCLKFTEHSHFSEAAFCGVTCDSVEQQVVMDPLKIIRNFFFLPAELENAKESKLLCFLRCKALSYKYNLPHCPVIGALCDAVLSATKHHSTAMRDRAVTAWQVAAVGLAEAQCVWKDVSRPTPASRDLVERHFGISHAEQLKMEGEFHKGFPVFLNLTEYTTFEDIRHFEMHYATNVKHRQLPDSLLPEVLSLLDARNSYVPSGCSVKEQSKFNSERHIRPPTIQNVRYALGV